MYAPWRAVGGLAKGAGTSLARPTNRALHHRSLSGNEVSYLFQQRAARHGAYIMLWAGHLLSESLAAWAFLYLSLYSAPGLTKCAID